VPTHILALHKIKNLEHEQHSSFLFKNCVSSYIFYEKTDHHVHGMKKNFLSIFMSGLNVVNDQNLFNNLAKNHHVCHSNALYICTNNIYMNNSLSLSSSSSTCMIACKC